MKRPLFFLASLLAAASLACNISVGPPATAATPIIVFITETSAPSETPALVIPSDTASATATVPSATFPPPTATWTPHFTSTFTATSTFTPVPPSGIAARFLHIASAGNTTSNYTNVNNSFTNGNPNTLVFITANWNPGGGGSGVYDNAALGVWYNTSKDKWSIFNQNLAAMPLNAVFNVLIPGAAFTSLVHTATAGNTSGHYTLINNSQSNNNPNAILLVTPNWNPGGGSGVYNNSSIGVWYSSSENKWSVFNQGFAAMPANASFNVMILSAAARTFVHTASAGNTNGHYTLIDHSSTNNNPNALVFVTANWNPGGGSGVYNNSHIGVWYDTSTNRWSIFNQDFAAMPANASFNVFVRDP